MMNLEGPPDSIHMRVGPEDKTCQTEYSDEVRDAILYLQKYLHHKNLDCSADSSTMERIGVANLTPEQEVACINASRTITHWLHYDLRWFIHYVRENITDKVANKESRWCPGSKEEPFYSQLEVVAEVFYTALRILYNWKEEKGLGPWFFFKTVLYMRKESYKNQFIFSSKREVGIAPHDMDNWKCIWASSSPSFELLSPAYLLSTPDEEIAVAEEREYWEDMWDLLVGYEDADRLERLHDKKVSRYWLERPVSNRGHRISTMASFAHCLVSAQRQSSWSPCGPSFLSLRALYFYLAR